MVVAMKGVPHPKAASEFAHYLPSTPVSATLRRFMRHQNIRTLLRKCCNAVWENRRPMTALFRRLSKAPFTGRTSGNAVGTPGIVGLERRRIRRGPNAPPENTAEAGNTETGHIGNPAMKVSFAWFASDKVVPGLVVIRIVIARNPENFCQTGNFFEFDVQRPSAILVAQKHDCVGQSVVPLGLDDVLDNVSEFTMGIAAKPDHG